MKETIKSYQCQTDAIATS